MKLLILTDLHFGLKLAGNNIIPKQMKNDKEFLLLENKYNFFLEDVNNPYTLLLLKSLDWLEQYVINVDKIIILGDIFDLERTKEKISTIELYLVKQALYRLYEINNYKKLIIISGNHDLIKKSNSFYSPLHIFSEIADVYYTPSILKIDDTTTTNNVFGLIPYDKYTRQDILELLEDFNEKVNDNIHKIIFSHIDILDFYVEKIGIEKDLVKTDDFKGFIVFNGHYHIPKKYGESFYNVGSLIATDFNHVSNFNNGFIIYDTETEKVSFYKNPYNILFLKVKEQTLEKLETYVKTKYNCLPYLALDIYIENESRLGIIEDLPIVTFKKTYKGYKEKFKFLEKVDLSDTILDIKELLQKFWNENYKNKYQMDYIKFLKKSKKIVNNLGDFL